MAQIPNPPKLFFCKECKVYFYSNSKLTHPTHTTCKTHKTFLVKKEKEEKNDESNK